MPFGADSPRGLGNHVFDSSSDESIRRRHGDKMATRIIVNILRPLAIIINEHKCHAVMQSFADAIRGRPRFCRMLYPNN